jgi:hypothetical protein
MTKFSVKLRGKRECINIGDVEQGVPMPRKGSGRKVDSGMFPYHGMGSGDSFYVAYCNGADGNSGMTSSQRALMRGRIMSSSRYREKMHPNEKYASRAFTNGVRVWRVA